MLAILIHPITNGLKIPREDSQRLHLITRWLQEPFASERAVHPKKNAERIVLTMGPCFSGLLKGDTIEADMRTGHGIGTRDSPMDNILKPATVSGKELHQSAHDLRSYTHVASDIQCMTHMDVIPDPNMMVSALAG